MENKIINTILRKHVSGDGEVTLLELVVNTEKSEPYLSLTKTVSEAYKTDQLEEVIKVFDKITGGNGRRKFTPKDLF